MSPGVRKGLWVGTVFLALIAGWGIGRLDRRPPPGSATRVRTPRPPVEERSSEASNHPEHGGRADALLPSVTEEIDADQLVEALKTALRESGGRLEHAQALTTQMTKLLSERPELLASFLKRFGEESDSEALYGMMQILMDIRSPEVVPSMLALARDRFADPRRRLGALGVLDGQNDWAALSTLTEFVQSERDPEILPAAIHALPEGGAFNVVEARRTTFALTNVLSMESPEYESAREAAALALGQWTSESADRDHLLRTLRNDSSARVRMAAAFGLIFSSEKDPATLHALAEVVKNPDEDLTVRRNAWRALGAARILPDEYVGIYRAFEKEQTHPQ